MKKWTGNTIRKTWLDYFVKNNHYLYPSQSLIPHNDPSLLWINSGVATLKKYFSGEETPLSKRLTSSQRSIRTNDIFNIGVTSRHHTFFEMLGNFSIGDYFKKEAIKFAYDLLVNHYFMDVNKLYFTVYEKDNEYILDFIVSRAKGENLDFVAHNIHHYKKVSMNGNNGIQTNFYSHRAYGDDITPFLKNLNTENKKLIMELTQTNINCSLK